MRFFCFIFLLGIALPLNAQSPVQQVFEKYSDYRETSIQNRRFKHADIVPLVERMSSVPDASVLIAGKSVEDRAIYQVRIGNGPVKVLMWSQMHGDESTATMAIMDLFNFFRASGDGFDAFRKEIKEKLSLYFVPMLNPDGAERFTRRNSFDIDINRDALSLQTPEGRLLKQIRDQLNADWGFNLHDQSRYTTAGNKNKTATLSFLAPAYDEAKNINHSRKRALQLIAGMNKILQPHLPGKVARYDDTFEPRAFGDNIQKWGTSTILIESGGLDGDPEKQQIRKLNFLALLHAFQSIAAGDYAGIDTQNYFDLPVNERYRHDLILRNVRLQLGADNYTVDLGFLRDEVSVEGYRQFYYRSRIMDLGDLSTFFGYEEFDMSGYTVVPGKIYPTTLQTSEELNKLNPVALLKEGYTAVVISFEPATSHQHLPLQLVSSAEQVNNRVRMGGNPALLFQKNGKNAMALVNGQIVKL